MLLCCTVWEAGGLLSSPCLQKQKTKPDDERVEEGRVGSPAGPRPSFHHLAPAAVCWPKPWAAGEPQLASAMVQ